MHSQMKEFHQQTMKVPIQPVLEDIFLTVNNLVLVWGNHYLEEFHRTKSTFSKFFKYNYHATCAIQETLQFKQSVST